MTLSAVPAGFLSLNEIRAAVSAAIQTASGNDLETLKKIVDPNLAQRAPPRAISTAAYKALYPYFGKGYVEAFVMHPSSGDLVRVPPHVFLSSKDPFQLFGNPHPDIDPGFPDGFKQFRGLVMFVKDDDTAQHAIDGAIAAALEGKPTEVELRAILESRNRGTMSRLKRGRPPGQKRNAAIAAKALYPPLGQRPKNTSQEAALAEINEWLAKKGLPKVSMRTALRALGERK